MSNLAQAFGGHAFDASQVEPQESFEPLPNGKYLVMATDSEVKATKAGNGQYLQLVWTVLDGDYKGRKIFDRLNISNPNKTAEEIGLRALSAICHAAGRTHVTDSSELHNIPLVIKVVVKRDNGYEPSNEVKGYFPADGATPAPVAAPAAAPAYAAPTPAPAHSAPAAAATPPWKRK